MRHHVLFLIALAGFTIPLTGQAPVDYRFEKVRSKVVIGSGAAETRASAGTVAHGGDRIRTGWFGYALLEAPRYAARFEIFSGSDVTLEPATPGVILSLDRGRLKAVFDKLTGEEPRMVRTPGALLAVRGTRYGVEVGRDGVSDLVVFDGVVEVTSPLRPQPLLVHAGETCHYGTHTPPVAMPMGRGMSEGMWQQHGAGMNGDGMNQRGGMDGMTAPGAQPKPPPMSGSGHGH